MAEAEQQGNLEPLHVELPDGGEIDFELDASEDSQQSQESDLPLLQNIAPEELIEDESPADPAEAIVHQMMDEIFVENGFEPSPGSTMPESEADLPPIDHLYGAVGDAQEPGSSDSDPDAAIQEMELLRSIVRRDRPSGYAEQSERPQSVGRKRPDTETPPSSSCEPDSSRRKTNEES